MPEDEERLEDLVDAAAYDLGLKLDLLLLRTNQWAPSNTDPRRQALGDLWGRRVPSEAMLSRERELADDMLFYRASGRLPTVRQQDRGLETHLRQSEGL